MSKITPAARYALTAHQQQSVKVTRAKLELALERIVAGTPHNIERHAKISIANIAREAEIDRATIYRFHRPIVEKINGQKSPSEIGPETQSNIKEKKQPKNKKNEYLELAETAQRQVESLARINYKLQARIDDLEQLLETKDKIITALRHRGEERGNLEEKTNVRLLVHPK